MVVSKGTVICCALAGALAVITDEQKGSEQENGLTKQRSHVVSPFLQS
jgi:hypothetical protein